MAGTSETPFRRTRVIGAPPDIDLSRMPKSQRRSLAKGSLRFVEEFFENSENVRGFEEWKAQQGKKEEATA